MQRNSFTFTLTPAQQALLREHLLGGNYRPIEIPYTSIAADGPECKIALYTSGKLVVQGRGAQDWVTFTLEPQILQEVRLGYEDVLSPELSSPHMGIDESGKGDFFGPLVIAAAYVDPALAPQFRDLNVRDSKTISSDRKAEEMAEAIVKLLGGRFAIVQIGPRAYNRLYAKMQNVNQMLAWGHARAIEDLLEKVPDCPRALSDQFGPTRQIEQALMKKGRRIKLVQRPKAESDPAVAAASVLARAIFVRSLREMQKKYGVEIPKGASSAVKDSAKKLIERAGPGVLLDVAKCHFKTTDEVLAQAGHARSVLGAEGAAVSKSRFIRRGGAP
jgi:ribonuclease HIII